MLPKQAGYFVGGRGLETDLKRECMDGDIDAAVGPTSISAAVECVGSLSHCLQLFFARGDYLGHVPFDGRSSLQHVECCALRLHESGRVQARKRYDSVWL
jgi:hypothetical protein